MGPAAGNQRPELLWLPLLQHPMLAQAVKGESSSRGGSSGLLRLVCAACQMLLVLLEAISGRSACWSSAWRNQSPMQR